MLTSHSLVAFAMAPVSDGTLYGRLKLTKRGASLCSRHRGYGSFCSQV